MKARLSIVAGLLFLAVSCQPFLFSLFPGYLADATAIADVSGYFLGASVEHFDFCVLNNGSVEYVFLVATLFSGQKSLHVFNSDLGFIASFTNISSLGSRHFVDYSGNFVIGGCYFSPPMTSASLPNAIDYLTWGPDGDGCVIRQTAANPGNVFLSSSGPTLDVLFFGTAWGGSPTSEYVYFNSMYTGNFNLVYSRRLLNVSIGGYTINAAILVFRDKDTRPENGYAVVLLEGPSTGYAGIKSCEPLLTTLAPYHYVYPVGAIESEVGSAHAVNDGLVIRGADKAWRLIGFDGQVKAVNRDNGASGDVLVDFSPADYYYVFDPASLKLFKARDWWQKN